MLNTRGNVIARIKRLSLALLVGVLAVLLALLDLLLESLLLMFIHLSGTFCWDMDDIPGGIICGGYTG